MVAAGAIGAYAARHYAARDLTLSHYDARGHLVVARRIVDSVTPGWQQVGAVWLPLPHLLNAAPAQHDWSYRTGASGILVSMVSYAAAIGALSWMLLVMTASRGAAVAGAAVFALNPNVLYLQATPMTEPLLLALTTSAVAGLMAWCRSARPAPWCVGMLFALACLTRFEAWPVTVAALGAAGWARWREGRPGLDACCEVARIAIVPAGAIAAFMTFSRIVVGRWFVSEGFFVPDPTFATPGGAAGAVWHGLLSVSEPALLYAAGVGLIALAGRAFITRARAPDLMALALCAAAALPWAAFLRGHPFRVRYMVPLLAAEAIGVGMMVGLLRRFAGLAAVPMTLLAATAPGPLTASAAMVVEAQWDRPRARERQVVTRCLKAGYRGDTIMASMGSLGHYMQELSAIGLNLRDFLHEGNGDIWLNALATPRPYVGWVLIDEQSEGGDTLARIANGQPSFLDGFDRVCQGGGVALYRRRPETRTGAVDRPDLTWPRVDRLMGVPQLALPRQVMPSRRQNRTLRVNKYENPPRSILGPENSWSSGRSPSACW